MDTLSYYIHGFRFVRIGIYIAIFLLPHLSNNSHFSWLPFFFFGQMFDCNSNENQTATVCISSNI